MKFEFCLDSLWAISYMSQSSQTKTIKNKTFNSKLNSKSFDVFSLFFFFFRLYLFYRPPVEFIIILPREMRTSTSKSQPQHKWNGMEEYGIHIALAVEHCERALNMGKLTKCSNILLITFALDRLRFSVYTTQYGNAITCGAET